MAFNDSKTYTYFEFYILESIYQYKKKILSLISISLYHFSECIIFLTVGINTLIKGV